MPRKNSIGLEMSTPELPLSIVEGLIAEATRFPTAEFRQHIQRTPEIHRRSVAEMTNKSRDALNLRLLSLEAGWATIELSIGEYSLVIDASDVPQDSFQCFLMP